MKLIFFSARVYRPSSASNESDSPSEASPRSRSSAVWTGTVTRRAGPPSKAISSQPRSRSATAHQLCQNPTGGVRVEERDLTSEEASTRPLVDELGPGGREAGELGPDVGDLESDVMHARAPLGKEL